MNQTDLIRQGIILAVLGFTALVAHVVQRRGDPARTTVASLRLGSYAVFLMAALLTARSAMGGRQAVRNQPSLSVRSVVVYVYGLGLLVYVSTYCLLDTGVCRYFYLLCTAGISIDDFLERWGEGKARKVSLAAATVFAIAAFCVKILTSPDTYEVFEAILSGKLYVFIFGFLLPATAPMAFLAIRSRRHYTPVTVGEFMHLSMPFAVHASVSNLLSLSLITYTPETLYYSLNSTLSLPNATEVAHAIMQSSVSLTESDVASPFLAACMVPAVFFAIQTTLLYSIADFLAPAAFVAGVRQAAEGGLADWGSAALLAAGTAAMAARLYTCAADRDDYAGVLYTSEDEDSRKMSQQDSQVALRSLQQVILRGDEDDDGL